MAKIDSFFRLMNAQGASDLHLVAGDVPCLRVNGDLEEIQYHELDDAELTDMLGEIAPDEAFEKFLETGDLDFAYEIEDLGRYRANYFKQSHGVSAVFRQIPTQILTIEQLGLPPVARSLAMLSKGLVLVTGPTGSGKSTTLAAMIDYANKNRRDHILTIEDPVEFKHRRVKCLINHREVGMHTESFGAALRGALREDPDIILVGEMRDYETIAMALEAAATGHLVFGTLHTPNAMKTVDRIIDVFPTDAQEQVRATLSESLKGVIAQTLFKRADAKGRCAALEVLIGTPAVANLVREGKTHQLVNVMQTGKKLGMQMLDDAIDQLLADGKIAIEEAFEKCTNKERFAERMPELPEEFQELSKGGTGGGGGNTTTGAASGRSAKPAATPAATTARRGPGERPPGSLPGRGGARRPLGSGGR